MPSDLAFAEPEMNPDQEALLSRDSMIRGSSVDATPETPTAQPKLKGLRHLPTEVLLEIANNLPLSSIIFLTRTCRRIHHDMGISVEKLLGGVPARRPSARGHLLKTPRTQSLGFESDDRSRVHEDILSSIEYPLVEESSSVQRSERLIFLCMLEREHQIDPSRAVCSSCVATHDVCLFAPDSLTLNHQSEKKECLGRAGRMWICPHWQCGYDEFRDYSTPFEHHHCGATADRDPRPLVASLCGFPVVRWPLMKLYRGHAPPSTSEVANALRSLTASACPHFTMNDPFILRHYSPNCRRMNLDSPHPFLQPCICEACLLRTNKCPECGTSIDFDVTGTIAGGFQLEVYVLRMGVDYNGNFNGATDPAWIKQLALPSEFEALERAWNESASRLNPSGGEW